MHYVVTGASTGIGLATVEALLTTGANVFATARKDDDLARLAKLGAKPVRLDVTDAASIAAAAAEISAATKSLDGLVNNAGIAVPGPLLHLPIAELRKQFEVNVFGQIAVTQALLPLLGARKDATSKPGRIVNVTSVSGRIAAPFVGAYSGSKHAMEGLSDALRRELMLYGIDVIVVAPGSVQTPIWDKAEQFDDAPYRATDYYPSLRKFADYFIKAGRNGLPASTIATAIVHALTTAKPKARYTLVGKNKLLRWTLPMLLPKRFVDRQLAKALGLKRGA
jgi:NAD(P)-dependent dehydrogenase (short-subunit alcohol dehydrogenase family)